MMEKKFEILPRSAATNNMISSAALFGIALALFKYEYMNLCIVVSSIAAVFLLNCIACVLDVVEFNAN